MRRKFIAINAYIRRKKFQMSKFLSQEPTKRRIINPNQTEEINTIENRKKIKINETTKQVI